MFTYVYIFIYLYKQLALLFLLNKNNEVFSVDSSTLRYVTSMDDTNIYHCDLDGTSYHHEHNTFIEALLLKPLNSNQVSYEAI